VWGDGDLLFCAGGREKAQNSGNGKIQIEALFHV
jgi:hypothetical protein